MSAVLVRSALAGLLRIFDLFEYFQPRVIADWSSRHLVYFGL